MHPSAIVSPVLGPRSYCSSIPNTGLRSGGVWVVRAVAELRGALRQRFLGRVQPNHVLRHGGNGALKGCIGTFRSGGGGLRALRAQGVDDTHINNIKGQTSRLGFPRRCKPSAAPVRSVQSCQRAKRVIRSIGEARDFMDVTSTGLATFSPRSHHGRKDQFACPCSRPICEAHVRVIRGEKGDCE